MPRGHAYPYTSVQRTDMVAFYFTSQSTVQTQTLFRERYPDCPTPTRALINRTVQNLRDYGQFSVPVHAQDRSRWPRHSEAFRTRIFRYFSRHPEASTRDAAARFGTSQFFIWKLLNAAGLHPFHFQKVQDIVLADYPRRVQFCRWVLQNLHLNILWSDEATFTRVGLFNVHNEHLWCEANPHATRRDSFQSRFSVNVWAGILNNHLIGPHFIDGNLNGPKYEDFLRNILPTLLQEVPQENINNLYYQQDGAPAHFALRVRNYLDECFPERWIGRNGPVAWPPRSPDLTPLDFFLWGEVKRRVYTRETNTVEELRQKIIEAFNSVKANEFVLGRLKDNLRRRAELCVHEGGGHIEHKLKYV